MSLQITKEQTQWTQEQRAALSTVVAGRASEQELLILLHFCQQSGLSPFDKGVYAISRGGKLSIQTSIDGFRKIASRYAAERGLLIGNKAPVYFDAEGKSFPFAPKNLHAVQYTATVKGPGVEQEHTVVLLLSEYQQNSPFWKKSAGLMLTKCAEAVALRAVAPEVLGGVYTADEFNAANDEKNRAPAVPSPYDIDDDGEVRDGFTASDGKRHLVSVLQEEGADQETAISCAKRAWELRNAGEFVTRDEMLALVEAARGYLEEDTDNSVTKEVEDNPFDDDPFEVG